MQIPNFCVKTTFQACRQPLEAAQDPGGRQYGRQVLDLDAREKRESFPVSCPVLPDLPVYPFSPVMIFSALFFFSA
jgi:hypothetical protein